MNPSKENIKADFIYNTSTAKSDRELYRICPSKLTKHELEDLYFSLLETNANLQNTVSGQQERIKMLSSKMQRMITAQKVHQADERNNCYVPASCAVNQYKQTILEMRRNNERMAERIRQLNIKLTSAKQIGKTFQLSTTRDYTATPSNSPCSTDGMSLKSVEVQTEPMNVSGEACDRNRCRTHLDELKQKIVDIEQMFSCTRGLSNTHNGYSDRIGCLDIEVQRCRCEMLPVCNQRVTNKQELQKGNLINLPVDKIGAADDELAKLKTQLLLEQQKVANLEAELIAEKIVFAATRTSENRLTNIQEKAFEDDIESDSFSWNCNCTPVCPNARPTAKHMCTALPYNNGLSSEDRNVFKYSREIRIYNDTDNLKYDDANKKKDSFDVSKRKNGSDSSEDRPAGEDSKSAPIVSKRDDAAEDALKQVVDDNKRTSAGVDGLRENAPEANKPNDSLDDNKWKHGSEDIWQKHAPENNKGKDTPDDIKRRRGFDDNRRKNAPDYNKRNVVADVNKRKHGFDDVGRKNASYNNKTKDLSINKKRDKTPENSKRRNSIYDARSKIAPIINRRGDAPIDKKRDDTLDNITLKDLPDDYERKDATEDNSRTDEPGANTHEGIPDLIKRIDTPYENRPNYALDDSRPNDASDDNTRKDAPDTIARSIIRENKRRTKSLDNDRRKDVTQKNKIKDVPDNKWVKDAPYCNKCKDVPVANKRSDAPDVHKRDDNPDTIRQKDSPENYKRKGATENNSSKEASHTKGDPDGNRFEDAPVTNMRSDAPGVNKRDNTPDNIKNKDSLNNFKLEGATEHSSRKDTPDVKGTPDGNKGKDAPVTNRRGDESYANKRDNIPDNIRRKDSHDDNKHTVAAEYNSRKDLPDAQVVLNCNRRKDAPVANNSNNAPGDNMLDDTRDNIRHKDSPENYKREASSVDQSNKDAYSAVDVPYCNRCNDAPVPNKRSGAPDDSKTTNDTPDNIRLKDPPDDYKRQAAAKDNSRKDADANMREDTPYLIRRIDTPDEKSLNKTLDDTETGDNMHKDECDDRCNDAFDNAKYNDAPDNNWREDVPDRYRCKDEPVSYKRDYTPENNKFKNAPYAISGEHAPITNMYDETPDDDERDNAPDDNKCSDAPDDYKRNGATEDNTYKNIPDHHRRSDTLENNRPTDVPDGNRRKNSPDDTGLRDSLENRNGIDAPDVRRRENIWDDVCTDVSNDNERDYACSESEDARNKYHRYKDSPDENIHHMFLSSNKIHLLPQDMNLQEYPYTNRNQALSTRDLNANENKNISEMDKILDLQDYYWTEDAAAANNEQDLANDITRLDSTDNYNSRNSPRTEVSRDLHDREEIQSKKNVDSNIKKESLFYDADAYRLNINKQVPNTGMDRSKYSPDVDISQDRADSNRLQTQSDGKKGSTSKDTAPFNVECSEKTQPSGLKLISPKHDRHNSLQIPGPIPVSETIQKGTIKKTNTTKGSSRNSNSKERKGKVKEPSNDTGHEKGKAIIETSTVTEGRNLSARENDRYVCKADQMIATDMKTARVETGTSYSNFNTPRGQLSSFEMRDVATTPMNTISIHSDYESHLLKLVDTVEREIQVEPQPEAFAKRRLPKDGDVPIPTPREVLTYRNKDGTLCFKTTPASERFHCCPCDKQSPCGGARNKSVQSEAEISQYLNTVEQGTGTPYRSEMTRSTSPDNTVYDVPSTPRQQEEIPPTPQGIPQNISTQTIEARSAASSNIPLKTDVPSKGEFLSTAAISRMESGDKPHEVVDCSTTTTEMLTMQKMEKTLQALAEELARCKELLLSQQPGESSGPERTILKTQENSVIDDSNDSRQHVLKPGKALETIGEKYAPRCVFTLHIGTVVLSDEAVVNTRDRSLILTWKFYDQNTSMTRIRAGRVMLFDVSTEYDIKITDEFLDYMKHAEMVIVVCEMYKEQEPFATCALPLRHALLHTNRRADMSLALMAGPQMLCARNMNKKSSDSLDAGDEMGVIDLWCMLRVDAKLVPAINRAMTQATPILKKPPHIMKHILDDDDAEFHDVDVTLANLQKNLDRSYQDVREMYKYDKHMSPSKRQDSSLLVLPTTVPVDQGPPTRLMKKYQYRWDNKAVKKQPDTATQAPPMIPTAAVDLSNYPSTSRSSLSKALRIEPLDQNNNKYRRDCKSMRKQPGSAMKAASINTISTLDLSKYPLSSRNITCKPQTMDPMEDRVSGGILINEVVANIKTPEDMKHAMEKSNRTSLHNVARLPIVEDDLLSQTHSNVSSHRSMVRLLDRSKKDLNKMYQKDNKRGSHIKLRRADDIFQPAMWLHDDHSEASELYRKYENIANFFASKTDTKKQVTIQNFEESDEEGPQKEAALSYNLKKEDQTIDITILWLALNEECEAMSNPRIQRVYVSYTFLGRSGADMETPFSLPKPRHHVDKCYFNFKKKFHLESDDIVLLGHMAQCRATSKISADFKECVVFSVISEPPEDPLGLETCEDIGYAYLYLGDLLAYSAGSSGHTEVIPVNARGGASVCGVLAIRVDGLEVLRRCAELMTSESVPSILE